MPGKKTKNKQNFPTGHVILVIPTSVPRCQPPEALQVGHRQVVGDLGTSGFLPKLGSYSLINLLVRNFTVRAAGSRKRVSVSTVVRGSKGTRNTGVEPQLVASQDFFNSKKAGRGQAKGVLTETQKQWPRLVNQLFGPAQ